MILRGRNLPRRGLLAWVIIWMTACSPGLRAAEIVVFAAASLSDALRDIGRTYEKESGDHVLFNFGASSLLERQVEEGAGADIFFSADDAKMDALEKKGLVVAGSRRELLGNSLVVVVLRDSPFHFRAARDLTDARVGRLALAEPTAVPAGVYAREYLAKQGLWAALQTRIIPAENVRAALAAVESGNVDAGMVYKTDAAISKKIRIAFEIPAADGPEINYPVALMKDSTQPEAARRFLDSLDREQAKEVFRRYGFLIRK